MRAYPSGDALLSNPTTGIADCCARAEIGSTLQQSVPSRTATTAVTEYEHLIFSIEIAAGHDTRDIGNVL